MNYVKTILEASNEIKHRFADENVTHINPEIYMIDGLLVCVDDFDNDKVLFSAVKPGVPSLMFAFTNWCGSLAYGNSGYDFIIVPF